MNHQKRGIPMKNNALRYRCLLFVIMVLLFSTPSLSVASEAEILKRLEQLEKEVKFLREQNSRLLQMEDARQREKESQLSVVHQPEQAETQQIEKDGLFKDWYLNTPENQVGSVMGKYYMKIYGRVKFDANYDTKEFRKYNDFLGAAGAGDAGNDSTNFNPRDSRIGFKILRRDEALTSLALIETDFYGDNNGNNLIPRMRLGYLKLTNTEWATSLLIGQDWTPVAQLNPPTIDFGLMAASGNLWWRVPQITVRKEVGNLEFLGSVMKHRRISTAEDDRMPWALGRIAYNNGFMGEGGLLAIGGGYREETLNHDRLKRWLVALELKKKFGNFTFLLEPWIGDGLDKEWLRYDMGINDVGNKTILSRGGFASLAYKMNSRQLFSLGYGIDDPKNGDMNGMDLVSETAVNDRRFTKNEMVFLNLWHTITPAVKMGFEMMYLDTERFGDSEDGMRYTLSAMYGF